MLRTLLLSLVSLAISVSSTQLCNGHAEFCNRSYGNVTFIGAHDSAFYSTIPLILSADQHYDVTRQLDDGIRLLQSQGHHQLLIPDTASIELCHTNCALYDGGSLLSYLQKVKAWLDANPNEVLTILFTNPDGIDITTWGNTFIVAGIADLAFTPSFNSTPNTTLSWPTLGAMISSGKRVVIFLDTGANRTEVDFILDEFTYMWETPFDQTDSNFPCTVDRPPSLRGHTPTGRLSCINHFLDLQLPDDILIPDRPELQETNAVAGHGSLGIQANQCAAMWGSYPNFILVDFYDVTNGSVFEVAASINHVSYNSGSFASSASAIYVLNPQCYLTILIQISTVWIILFARME